MNVTSHLVQLSGIALAVLLVAMPAEAASSPSFYYTFNADGTLHEASSLSESTSPYWWLNSGAQLRIVDGIGETVQGDFGLLEKFSLLYAANNPLDTDDGLHPQNIFRLISKWQWENYSEHAYFNVTRYQLSLSPNRNASNGLLLFNRYKSGATAYYAGLRVDGAVVVKKKLDGRYYTLGYKKVLPGTYNSLLNPNLIPKDTWIGIRNDVVTNPDGSVSIKLYTDIGKTGTWTLVLETLDDGVTYGAPIVGEGAGGIRTDFMDVQFDNFKVVAF